MRKVRTADDRYSKESGEAFGRLIARVLAVVRWKSEFSKTDWGDEEWESANWSEIWRRKKRRGWGNLRERE